jgi:hypothetical protein
MYMDYKPGGKYFGSDMQLSQCNMVIVQLDNIMMVLKERDLERFDLVVMDESESLLHHSTSETLAKRGQDAVFDQFLRVGYTCVRTNTGFGS